MLLFSYSMRCWICAKAFKAVSVSPADQSVKIAGWVCSRSQASWLILDGLRFRDSCFLWICQIMSIQNLQAISRQMMGQGRGIDIYRLGHKKYSHQTTCGTTWNARIKKDTRSLTRQEKQTWYFHHCSSSKKLSVSATVGNNLKTIWGTLLHWRSTCSGLRFLYRPDSIDFCFVIP